jgi:cytosine/adenosine deaminase-related metal-dependent hydrolase
MSIGIKAKWIIAYDGKENRLLRDGIVVIEDQWIKYVGKNYNSKVDQWIKAPTHVVTAGFICTHAHASSAPKDKSFIDDTGAPSLYMSSLGENLSALGKSIYSKDYHVFAKYSMAELIRSGCTTMIELGMVDTIGAATTVNYIDKMGMRAVEGVGISDGRWVRHQDANFMTVWDGPETGLKLLDEAEKFIKKYDGEADGRIIGALYPSTVDQVSEGLQRAVRAKADALKCPVSIHAGQWVVEFQNMIRMYKKTPIEYLHYTGLLKKDLIIGHGWALAGHPLLAYPPVQGTDDFALLANSGATVSHDPLVFIKRGNKMHSHSKYVEKGINVSIGCDTSPQDMLNEMRMASYTSKLADWTCFSGTAREIFNSATIGGAKAINRKKLGKLAKGCLADIIVINMQTLNNVPCRDPIKNIVNSATRSDVDFVIINGKVVLEEGNLVNIDEEKLVKQVQKTTEAVWDRIPENHYLNQHSDLVSPQSFKPWNLNQQNNAKAHKS